MKSYPTEDLDQIYQESQESIPIFWERIGHEPDLAGMRVLDLGCGLGGMVTWAARHGAASVVGLDTDSRLIEFAREKAAKEDEDVQSRIELVDVLLEDYQGEHFDIVITRDVFEHIMDLDGLLDCLKANLKPGGRVYAGFGPLYYSPLGHHGRTHPMGLLKFFPWIHLLEKEHTICTRLNEMTARGNQVFRYSDKPIQDIQDLGLSKTSFKEYCRAFTDSGLATEQLAINRSRSPLSKLFSALRRFPPLEELCTHNIYCILKKA